jgi:hypothetical protein
MLFLVILNAVKDLLFPSMGWLEHNRRFTRLAQMALHL